MNTNNKSKNLKRHYTPRGQTVAAKRIVLLDGKIVGRGRPALKGKSKRTVVYVPIGETYNPMVHGTGISFRPNRQGVLRRLKLAKLAKIEAQAPVAVETNNTEVIPSVV